MKTLRMEILVMVPKKAISLISEYSLTPSIAHK